MTTLTSKLDVPAHFPGMASRLMGDSALELAAMTLKECEVIELDFRQQIPSPSFADQFVGGLVSQLGLEEFKKRVKITNAPADIVPLLRHVVLRKAAGR